jgi:hypothetical protein
MKQIAADFAYGATRQTERRYEMKRLRVGSLSALLQASTVPNALGWG